MRSLWPRSKTTCSLLTPTLLAKQSEMWNKSWILVKKEENAAQDPYALTNSFCWTHHHVLMHSAIQGKKQPLNPLPIPGGNTCARLDGSPPSPAGNTPHCPSQPREVWTLRGQSQDCAHRTFKTHLPSMSLSQPRAMAQGALHLARPIHSSRAWLRLQVGSNPYKTGSSDQGNLSPELCYFFLSFFFYLKA